MLSTKRTSHTDRESLVRDNVRGEAVVSITCKLKSKYFLTHRFSAQGYRMPKPLINIVGRPMILWLLDNLKLTPEDTLWVGAQQDLAALYDIEARLRREYPNIDLRFVFIDFQTRGAAETLYIMLQVT